MPNSFLLANKRYRRDFAIAMGAYVLIVCAGPFLLAAIDEPQKWMFALMAVASALPAMFIFLLIGRWLKETDEYTRMRQGSAMLIAGGIVLSICLLWGFLELYDLVPKLWTFLVAPMFFANWGGVALIRKMTGQ